MLAAVVAVAVSIRIVYELLRPIALYLLIGLVLFAGVRLWSWYCGRW